MSIESDFQADPKRVAKAHPFYPSNHATGYDLRAVTETDLAGEFAGFKHTVINQEQKIARVRMEAGATDRGPAVLVKPSLGASDGLPVYFLPWDSRGAAVELTIPDADPTQAETTHPRFFFTAVLSGCSILFKGTAQKPTIFHCGTAGVGGGGQPTKGDSNDFFLSLVRDAEAKGLGRRSVQLPALAPSQVKSTDYMTTRSGNVNIANTEQDTLNAISTHFGDRIVCEGVVVWGILFGVRTGRDWRFYLQQNASILYKTMEAVIREVEVVKKKSIGPFSYDKTKTVTETKHQLSATRRACKPITLTKVFPGVGNVKMSDSWKSII